VVRFTDAAFEDLQRMSRKGDPQVVRWALKKCLLLERDPEAGEELRGGLIGYRKLTVGDRDWRIVWRVTHDDAGRPVVDVAEVWAVGARSDSEVYEEMQSRVATLSASPATMPLAEAIELLGKIGKDITPASAEPDPGKQPAVPEWLTQVLTTVVKMPPEQVDRLTAEQAQEIWDAYISTPR
jgi:mRNA interferase RelE/StbE